MTDGSSLRCGIDNVEIARVERLLLGATLELLRVFSKKELCDVGEGPGRAASLAAAHPRQDEGVSRGRGRARLDLRRLCRPD